MAVTVKDHANVDTGVGDTVHVVGVVTAVSPSDSHFNQLTINLTYPLYTNQPPVPIQVHGKHVIKQ